MKKLTRTIALVQICAGLIFAVAATTAYRLCRDWLADTTPVLASEMVKASRALKEASQSLRAATPVMEGTVAAIASYADSIKALKQSATDFHGLVPAWVQNMREWSGQVGQLADVFTGLADKLAFQVPSNIKWNRNDSVLPMPELVYSQPLATYAQKFKDTSITMAHLQTNLVVSANMLNRQSEANYATLTASLDQTLKQFALVTIYVRQIKVEQLPALADGVQDSAERISAVAERMRQINVVLGWLFGSALLLGLLFVVNGIAVLCTVSRPGAH